MITTQHTCDLKSVRAKMLSNNGILALMPSMLFNSLP